MGMNSLEMFTLALVALFVGMAYVGSQMQEPEPTLTPVCAEVKTLGQIRAEATRKLHEGKGLDYNGK